MLCTLTRPNPVVAAPSNGKVKMSRKLRKSCSLAHCNQLPGQCMHCTCDGRCGQHVAGQCGVRREGSGKNCKRAGCARDDTCFHSTRATCCHCRNLVSSHSRNNKAKKAAAAAAAAAQVAVKQQQKKDLVYSSPRSVMMANHTTHKNSTELKKRKLHEIQTVVVPTPFFPTNCTMTMNKNSSFTALAKQQRKNMTLVKKKTMTTTNCTAAVVTSTNTTNNTTTVTSSTSSSTLHSVKNNKNPTVNLKLEKKMGEMSANASIINAGKRMVKLEKLLLKNQLESSTFPMQYQQQMEKTSTSSTALNNCQIALVELPQWVQRKQYSNLTIRVETQYFHLHKFPVLMQSKWLKELYQNEMIELDHFVGGSRNFELLCIYMYSCDSTLLQLDCQNVVQLYCGAHLLQLKDTKLFTFITSFFEETVASGTTRDLVTILTQVALLRSKKEHIIQTIVTNFYKICINVLARQQYPFDLEFMTLTQVLPCDVFLDIIEHACNKNTSRIRGLGFADIFSNEQIGVRHKAMSLLHAFEELTKQIDDSIVHNSETYMLSKALTYVVS